MDALKNSSLLLPLVLTTVVYFASLCIYRLFFHPLAKFPGPKLAAITRYYEAYYDLARNGQYTFKIAEMHKEYGWFLEPNFCVTTWKANPGVFPLLKALLFESVRTSFTSAIQASFRSSIARMAVGTSTTGPMIHFQPSTQPSAPRSTISINGVVLP
jgi:hypothetical protein